MASIFNSICNFYRLFNYKIFKKKEEMKKISILTLLIITTLSTLSCSVEKDSLTEEKLVKYLKSRKKSYNFQEKSSLQKEKPINIPEPIYFDTLEEMENFLDAIDAAAGNHSSGMYYLTDIVPDDGAGGNSNLYYKESRYIGGFGVFMNIGFNVKNCQGSNLNSWISGFVLGVSYNHIGGSINTSNKTISYGVNGVLNYNIFVEGLGTVFSENVSYSGQYQCN